MARRETHHYQHSSANAFWEKEENSKLSDSQDAPRRGLRVLFFVTKPRYSSPLRQLRDEGEHSRLHVEDVFDALRCGCARRLGRLAVALLGPGHLDLLPGALSPLARGQRGGRGGGAGRGGVVVDELYLRRGGDRGRGRL